MTTTQIETLRDTINDALQVIPNASRQINQIEEPWTLGRELPGFRALRDGEEWHRVDWTQDMLEGGWRPLLLGEPREIGDKTGNVIASRYPVLENKANAKWTHSSTKRPLPILTPQQIAGGWIKWHGGENPVPGKRVSLLLRDGIEGAVNQPSEELVWQHLSGAAYIKGSEIIAYQVIEPKLVPLGPDDVRCGDEVKIRVNPTRFSILSVDYNGASLSNGAHYGFEFLMTKCTIRRRNSDAWVPCSKEAAE